MYALYGLQIQLWRKKDLQYMRTVTNGSGDRA
jgi:hypothetical protein